MLSYEVDTLLCLESLIDHKNIIRPNLAHTGTLFPGYKDNLTEGGCRQSWDDNKGAGN